MSELKATLGPWHTSKGAGIYTGVLKKGKLYRGKQVCRKPVETKAVDPSEVAKNWENNAHLIAAAPDLYELVDMVLKSIDGGGRIVTFSDDDCEEMRAALAKARGEP